jgi:NADH dehydrogenase
MARQVTIFGGAGFLGRHTVRALAKAGWRIRVACRHPNLALFLKPMGHVGQIDLVKCDITEPEQVRAALAGSDAAINLVGLLYGHFEEAHVAGAESVAKEAASAGLKALVQVSAIGADVDSHSAYAMTKGEGENRVRAAFPAATILRPSIIFGPEDGFFNKFASLARFLPFLPLIGGGKTRFQPVFVGDVAAAIVAALQKETARGKVYELCGPTTYTFRELMELTLAAIQRKRALVPVPFLIAKVKAFFLQLAPKPILTPDQVELLKTDNVAAPGALGLADLGIVPTTVEAEVGSYLWRYRPKGEYADMGPIGQM